MKIIPLHWQLKVLSFLIALVLSGCRFGNYSEPPKENLRTLFDKVELYFTAPQQFSTAVQLKNTQILRNTNASLATIPLSIRKTFSYPTYYAQSNDPTVGEMFIGIDQRNRWNTTTSIDENGARSIHHEEISEVSPLWDNPACLTQIWFEQKGTFDTSETGSFTFGDGSVALVSGRIKFTFGFGRVMEGDCDEDLNRLSYCYHNGVGCDGDELNAANNLYDLHIRQTNVLPSSEAANVRGLVYEVIFE